MQCDTNGRSDQRNKHLSSLAGEKEGVAFYFQQIQRSISIGSIFFSNIKPKCHETVLDSEFHNGTKRKILEEVFSLEVKFCLSKKCEG